MTNRIRFLAPLVVLGLTNCASVPSGADLDKLTADIVKASFRDQGLVKVDRLKQDGLAATHVYPFAAICDVILGTEFRTVLKGV